MKRILILAEYLPSGGWGGGVIMRSLTRNPPEGIKFLWTLPSAKKINEESYNGIDILDFRAGFFRGRAFSDYLLHMESVLFAWRFRKFLQQHEVDKLWAVVPTSYPQCYRLSVLMQYVNIPIHVSVHDDPVVETAPSKKQKARHILGTILKKAASIDVISSRMKMEYEQQFDVKPFVITRTIPEDFPKNEAMQDAKINILMGGYGNAAAPWPMPLIDSVAQLNDINEANLVLFDPKLKKFESDTVKVFDHINETEFNTILKTTTLGYACDDLDAERLHFAQMSLPTKVITYIGARIPFLYHGPADSTVGDLLKQYKAGVVVSSNDPDELYSGFMELLAHYNDYQQQCDLAVEDCFSEKKILKNIHETLLK
ncbi:glycosyltransferase family protein [Flavobacterium pallidum]|uniref:hypothetical protein n=1 Tax=Flavobacterium pallidum TaxID=2172098 RepID=UPI001C632E23|nr:hypothetical protein [Flavobacterium pallidum]